MRDHKRRIHLFNHSILIRGLALLFALHAFRVYSQKKSISIFPRQYFIQYAGSIGYLSIGAGYRVLKNKSVLSLHYGNIPEKFGGPLHIAAVKFYWEPIQIRIGNFYLKPINPGAFLSYHFGDEYYLFLPRSKYPKLYYWWSSGLRIHPSLSHSLEYNTGRAIQSIGIYLEWNTNDLYIASYFTNREYLKPGDIIKLGIGGFLRF